MISFAEIRRIQILLRAGRTCRETAFQRLQVKSFRKEPTVALKSTNRPRGRSRKWTFVYSQGVWSLELSQENDDV